MQQRCLLLSLFAPGVAAFVDDWPFCREGNKTLAVGMFCFEVLVRVGNGRRWHSSVRVRWDPWAAGMLVPRFASFSAHFSDVRTLPLRPPRPSGLTAGTRSFWCWLVENGPINGTPHRRRRGLMLVCSRQPLWRVPGHPLLRLDATLPRRSSTVLMSKSFLCGLSALRRHANTKGVLGVDHGHCC